MDASLFYPILIVLLVAVEEVYFVIAHRCGIVDRPIERSSHHQATICGGGIVFWVAVLFYLMMHPALWSNYGWFFAGLTLIAGISFLDDIKEVSSLKRLIVHFASLSIMLLQLPLPEGTPRWYMMLLVIWGTGTINAYNFMDGVNGMTAGYSAVLLTLLAYINQYMLPTPFVDEGLIHSALLSVLVFAYYNFSNRPRCFAGDVGAVSIAFVAVFLLSRLIVHTGNYAYLSLLLVYGVDSVLTILHRLMLRQNITQAHRMHLYQIAVNELGMKHTVVSGIYAGLQATIGIGLLLMPAAWQYYYFAGMLVVMGGVYVWFMRRYFGKHKPSLQMKRKL